MSVFDSINQIPLEDILTTVGISFRNVQGTLHLYEGDKPTDGWKGNVEEGNVTDFSGKRAYGDRVTFIMRLMDLDKKDAVQWYQDKFGIAGDGKMDHVPHPRPVPAKETSDASKEARERVMAKWERLDGLDEAQIEYLASRGIDYSRVKDYVKKNGEFVSCAIYDLTGMITIQNRTASATEKRFMIEKGTNSKGCFITRINKEIRKVYVVEGMFDFLSLAQYSENVIGLKSAKDGIEIVKAFFRRGYEVVLVPDNDEAGKHVATELLDIKFSVFDLAPYDVKDINELLVVSGYGEGIMDIIEDERSREPKNIDSAFDKFAVVQKSFKENEGRLGETTPFTAIDKYTQGAIKGKVYVIAGYSNTGKSQFSYEYAQYFIRKGKKVAYFSVEVDTGLLLGYVAKAYYKQSFSKLLSGETKIDRNVFEKLYLYDHIHDLDRMVKEVEMEKPDVVFLDFVQGFDCHGSSEYEKMTKIATEIQQMAIRKNIIVYSLSQVNNDSRNKDGGSVTLKGSGALFASSDVIMVLSEDAGQLKLTLAKNKFGKKMKEFEVMIDFDSGRVGVSEDPFNSQARLESKGDGKGKASDPFK